MSNHEIINAVVVRATTELFSAYGTALTLRDSPVPISDEDDVAFAAVIGFTGPAMRGTVTLAPSRAAAMPPEDPGLARDWVGELANQLAGRIKNQLLQYGVELYVTTPAVLRGQQLAAVPRGDLRPFVFDTEGGHVWIYFDHEERVGLVLEPCRVSVPNEGETIIF